MIPFWVIPRRLSSNCRRFGTHYLFHLHRHVTSYFIHLPMKMELIVSSETSAIRTQTPGNYPKRNNLILTTAIFIVCGIYIPHTILPLTYFIHLPMKMEPIVSSETSAIRTQTPGNYPKRNHLHLEHGESLRTKQNTTSPIVLRIPYTLS